MVIAVIAISLRGAHGIAAPSLDAPATMLWTPADEDPPAPFAATPVRAFHDEDMKVEVVVPAVDSDVDAELAIRTFDLRDAADWAPLREATVRLANLGERQNDAEDDDDSRITPFTFDVSSKGKRRALRETVALLDAFRAGRPTDADTLHLLELIHGVQNSFRYPVPKSFQLIPDIVPKVILQMRRHVEVAVDSTDDARDPVTSSFWGPTPPIGQAEMTVGLRRAELPDYNRDDCGYDGPKTGWGAHPGFDVQCGDLKFRFNLGDERYGGPFNTRIFDALGYHVAAIDAVPGLHLKYDRRVLTEYTSRRMLTMEAKLLFIPLMKRTITNIESPFDRISYAIMRDGSHVAGPELGTRLLRDTSAVDGEPRPEAVNANYNEAFEQGIVTLVWQPGTAEPDYGVFDAVGAWDYDQLDHASRREVRGLFVLAAWLDQFNMRWENTRVSYREDADGNRTLVHLLSDVGSGLGLARDLRHNANSDIEVMPWAVTERTDDGVHFSGFASTMENSAFNGVTGGDARWMLGRIAQFTEAQLVAALVATGMSAAEVRLALEKLVSKRQHMLADFGMAEAHPDVMARLINPRLDFDPRIPAHRAVVSAVTADGVVAPPIGRQMLRDGHLVPLR